MARLHLDQIEAQSLIIGALTGQIEEAMAPVLAVRDLLAAKYRRIAVRRGPMKAIVAIDHSVLTAA